MTGTSCRTHRDFFFFFTYFVCCVFAYWLQKHSGKSSLHAKYLLMQLKNFPFSLCLSLTDSAQQPPVKINSSFDIQKSTISKQEKKDLFFFQGFHWCLHCSERSECQMGRFSLGKFKKWQLSSPTTIPPWDWREKTENVVSYLWFRGQTKK